MESLVNNSLGKFYQGKKVLVTGHTGFKGAWLITWLHLLGANTKGYSLAPENDRSLFATIAPHIKFEHVEDDIRNKTKVQQAILDFNPDIIFHLAAQALVRRSYEIPAETFEVNAIGTANVLEAVNLLPGKCTVIVITTDKVYENKEINYHYKEDDVLGGYDPYSASKAATEIVVSSFRNSFFNPKNYLQHQKALASARAGNVIGGGDWSRDRIIPDIIRSLKSGNDIDVRNPTAVRPWQHVLEPLYGYMLLAMHLDNDAARFSSAYNFGPMENDHFPVKNLVETSIECWGSGSWKDISDIGQPHEAVLLQLNINKAISELKWQPKLKSKEAIQWTIDWYKKAPEAVVDFTMQQIKNYQSQ